MATPHGKDPIDLSSIEAIHDLNAARLALRWALERVHALQKGHAELVDKLDAEQKARTKAENDRRALERKVSLHLEAGEERLAYYSRMEEYNSLRLARKPDEKDIAQRELELSRHQEALRLHRIELEKEFEARRGILESEFNQFRLSFQQEAFEQAHRREQELLERQTALEERHSAERSRLAREVQGLAGTVDGEVSARVDDERRRLTYWVQNKESHWASERQAFEQEIHALLQRATEAEQAVRLLQMSGDQEMARHETEKKTLESEKALLQRDALDWRKRAEALNAKAGEAAGEAAAASSALHDSERLRALEERKRTLTEERERLLHAELERSLADRQAQQMLFADAQEQHRQAVTALEAALAERFAVSQKEDGARDEDWRRREEALTLRERRWHEELRNWRLLLEDKEARLEDLKTELLRAIQSHGRRAGEAGPSSSEEAA